MTVVGADLTIPAPSGDEGEFRISLGDLARLPLDVLDAAEKTLTEYVRSSPGMEIVMFDDDLSNTRVFRWRQRADLTRRNQ